jgi:hypothetical protein
MLKFLYDRRLAGGRKLRLFRLACCRRLPSSLPEAGDAVAIAECWAVGMTVDPERLARADIIMAHVAEAAISDQERPLESAYQARLLREIIGNPIRPAPIEPTWLTANVTTLAQAIYDESAFDRMPILGDALEDAGCNNTAVLEHCRSGGEHVRGCWVVDLLLENN